MRAPRGKWGSENQDSTVYMNHRSKSTQSPHGTGKRSSKPHGDRQMQESERTVQPSTAGSWERSNGLVTPLAAVTKHGTRSNLREGKSPLAQS